MTENFDLIKYGFDEFFSQQMLGQTGRYAARVISQHHDLYQVYSRLGAIQARVAGRITFRELPETSKRIRLSRVKF